LAERKLEIVLSGDAKSALRAFSATEKGAQGLAGKLDKLGGQMTDAGKKMTIGLTVPIVAGFGFAANAASDLNESVNVTGITFGKASPKIDSFVKTTATGLGQSERAARDATAQFGGLLQNLGLTATAAADWSIDLTTLASDLGSAFNTDPADAVEAIGSAIRGETEPIRRYNVMLDDASVRAKAVEMGLAATTAEVDRNGKAQATLQLIMEQTSKYQGDFANTSDGIANKQRILRARLEDTAASIGTKLLPVASSMLGVAERLLDGFAGLSDEGQALVLMASGVVAAIGPITYVAGRATQATVALAKATQFLATTQSAARLASLGLGAAITGGIVLYGSYRAILAAAREDQARFNDRNADMVNSQALVNAGLRQSRSALQDQAVELFMATKGSLAADDAAAALAETQRQLAPQIREATRTLKEMSAASGVSEERIAQLANEMGVNLGAMSEEARSKLAGAVAEVGRAVTPTERLEGVTETLGNEFATAAEEIDAFAEALDAALGVHLTAEEASIRLRDKIRDLSTELAEGRKEGESSAQMNDRLALSMIGVVEGAVAEVDALVRAGAISSDTRTQTDALRERLVALRDRFPGLRDQIDRYIGRLDAIPEGEATRISTPGLIASSINVGNWQGLLSRTPRAKPTRISTPGLIESNVNIGNWQGLLARTPGRKRTRFETPGLQEAINRGEAFRRLVADAIPRQWSGSFRATFPSARGDGPGGPIAPRGGTALNRVRAILPNYAGLQVTSTYRSPAQNRAVGGSPTSYHLDRWNPAVDIGGPTWQLDRFAAALRASGGWRELLWRTKGHFDHVHVAHMGGMVERNWPTLAGLGADERPAVLQVGERVQSRREVAAGTMTTKEGGTHVHFHIGSFVGSDERALAELWQRAKRKGYVGV
jgi:hypothetical protein